MDADRGPHLERCLASSVVRLSRTMEDKCEADGAVSAAEIGRHELAHR
jgi:hypothetical protein